MWEIFTFILAVAFGFVLLRYIQLQNEMTRMAAEISAIRGEEGNRQLTIGMHSPPLARLATAINALYDDAAAEKAAHILAMDDMRQSMANISHDLRTPLTSILGYLKLLHGETDAEKQRQYLDIAYTKAGALNRLVSNLFDLAKLESGGYAFEHEMLDLGSVIGEELAAAYTQFEAAGITPDIDLGSKPLSIIGDKNAITRALSNLLQNMVHHGEQPMAISGAVSNGRVVARFSNAAPNMSAGDVPQLFQRFFTADRMRSGENTGLGLAIVKELIEQTGGDIQARLDGGLLTFELSWLYRG